MKLIPSVGNQTVIKFIDSLDVRDINNINSFKELIYLINNLSNKIFNTKQQEYFNQVKTKLIHQVEIYLNKLQKNNIKVVCCKDDIYPKSLYSLKDIPVVIFVKGNEQLLNNYNFNKSIAVVGTRNYTNYGELYCRKFVKGLSKFNFCIISGLAYGIDSIAHDEALNNNACCIGVLGCGFDYIYPYKSKRLYKNIIQSGGILITEYLPDQKPDRINFPARNRIIAALAKGILVVEADRDSGSLITANIAFEIGRLVFAIPADLNRPKSQGCNHIISENIAKLVMDYKDILKEFNLNFESNSSILDSSENLEINDYLPTLSLYEKEIYELILNEKLNTDQIIDKIDLDTNIIFESLTNLESKKLIIRGEDDIWYATKISL